MTTLLSQQKFLKLVNDYPLKKKLRPPVKRAKTAPCHHQSFHTPVHAVEMAPTFKSVRSPTVQDYVHQRRGYKKFHPSPEAWEDQLLYFFLPDRFSDGNEKGYRDVEGRLVTSGKTPLFEERDRDGATRTPQDLKKWMDCGMRFNGGTIKGATSKLGYLKRMGVTTIWMGPIFKQISALETYHGYAIQNFLDVDPRFGTREELKKFVEAAHRLGIYVLLDIVLNHSGEVFVYEESMPMYTGKDTYAVKGFWNGQRDGLLPFAPVDEAIYPREYPNGAIWPKELQMKEDFFRKGCIQNMAGDPPEINEADFFDLKSLNIGAYGLDDFTPTTALATLCEAYKFWIAFADIDGFRIDTVRHMGDGPTKYFASAIHDYARKLGKTNFLMVGEISGHDAYGMVNRTGLDAALGIDDLQDALWHLPQGKANPADYFTQFQSANELKNPTLPSWKRNQIVTMIDDHDQTWRWDMKGRFCHEKNGSLFIHAAIGLNMCSLGIPCIYSGTEQNFDGGSDQYIGHDFSYADRFIRESMFGGGFGAFGSRNRHCFDEDTLTYQTVRAIAGLRRTEIALRRGGQLLREISLDGVHFAVPSSGDIGKKRLETVVAWSRLYGDTEIVCIISTHLTHSIDAWVRVEKEAGMRCIFPPAAEEDRMAEARLGGHGAFAAVRVTVPPHSFMMFKS